MNNKETAAAPVEGTADTAKEYSRCTEVLRAQGMAYPRTCQECGLGPCKRTAGRSHPVTPHLSMPGLSESSDSPNGDFHRQPCEQGSGDIAAVPAAPSAGELSDAEIDRLLTRLSNGETISYFHARKLCAQAKRGLGEA